MCGDLRDQNSYDMDELKDWVPKVVVEPIALE